MNAEVIKEFLVGLGFKVDEAGMAKFSSSIATATTTVVAIGTATTAAAATLVKGVERISSSFVVMEKLATQFRTSASAIDEFADAAGILGISEETSTATLKNLDRAIMDTSMGLGRAKKVFEDLGISVKDANGKIKPTSAVMAELNEKFKGMEYGKQIRVMERLGIDQSMLRYFNADMGVLRKDMEAIDKAADFDFDKAIAESKSFHDTWRTAYQEVQKWKLLFKTTMESVAVKLMPKMLAQIKAMTEGMVNFRRKVMENLPKAINAIMPVIGVVMRISEAFITVTARIATGAATIIGWILKVNNITHGWAGYIAAAMLAWKYLNLAFLKSPLGIIIALGAAVALLIDDYMTWKEGGESLIDWGGRFGTTMKVVTGILTAVLGTMVALKAGTLLYAGALAISKAATIAWAATQAIMTGVMNVAAAAIWVFNAALAANPIGLVIVAIVALIAAGFLLVKNWDKVKAWFASFFDWLLSGFTKVAGFASKVAAFFGKGGAQITTMQTTNTPRLTPSPQAAATINGSGSQTVQQKTDIHIQGGADPQATGRAVAREQGRVNADMTRNLRGATR